MQRQNSPESRGGQGARLPESRLVPRHFPVRLDHIKGLGEQSGREGGAAALEGVRFATDTIKVPARKVPGTDMAVTSPGPSLLATLLLKYPEESYRRMELLIVS